MTVSIPSVDEGAQKKESNADFAMLKVQEMYNKLPEGWSKIGGTEGKGVVRFVHVDGRVSLKHPSQDVIDAFVHEANYAKDTEKKMNVDPRKLEKYRRMLKSGVPRAGVEQTMRMDGEDIHEVFQALDGKDNVDVSNDPSIVVNTSNIDEQPRRIVINRNFHDVPTKRYIQMVRNGMSVAKVEDLAHRKYSNMLKAGVSWEAVHQAAEVDGVEIFQTNSADALNADTISKPIRFALKIQDHSSSVHPNFGKPSLKRYKMMIKAGVPIEAIKQLANVAGVDISELVNEKKTYFTPLKNGIEVVFEKEAKLTRLVSKLVQTVQKRATASTNLTVLSRVLYHALGSLRGVQHARDVYNATTDATKDTISLVELKSKRKPFLELANSLGIKAPAKWDQKMEIAGLDDLVKWIEVTFAAELEAFQDIFKSGMYDFDSLGELYQPGTRVFAYNVLVGGVGMVCEVAWNRYEEGRTLFGISKSFKVCYKFIVAVGDHFTVAEFEDTMENFEGKRSLRSLSFIPKDLIPAGEKELLIERYTRRGQMYNSIATTVKYMVYEKGNFYAKQSGGALGKGASALYSSGRVMVDTVGSYEAGHSIGTGHEGMVMGIKYKYREYMLYRKTQNEESKTNADTASFDSGDLILFDSVPEEYLTMTWPAVVGFSFKSKVWGDVLVDGLAHIKFQEDIFDKVVLPLSRKRMVKALVKHSADAFTDLVHGKGEGSVFLLYGKPGTGKTLTAEAVCEMLHKPLYTVSLGQLGTTASDLETNLEAILLLCSRWDALVLLDECDIFIEKRTSKGSLERNAMVSVMLRLVEYFKGVLFLTSNRVDSLDPAFKTRITLALRYDSLDQDARAKIWNNLLVASGFGDHIESGKVDVKVLAIHELNGREIKNCIRMAIALAEEDSGEFSQKYLLETISILNEFSDQMEKTEAY